MGEQAAHAGRIVKRIREFLTRHEPELEACNLPQVIEEAMPLLQRELVNNGVEWGAQFDPGLPKVQADSVLLEQVVINLIRNACDAMAHHQGPLFIRPNRKAWAWAWPFAARSLNCITACWM